MDNSFFFCLSVEYDLIFGLYLEYILCMNSKSDVI